MGKQTKTGQVISRFNTSVGDIVIYRGRRYEVDEICQVGVWFKSKRKEAAREFIYFYEAEKFNIVFA